MSIPACRTDTLVCKTELNTRVCRKDIPVCKKEKDKKKACKMGIPVCSWAVPVTDNPVCKRETGIPVWDKQVCSQDTLI